ncbi:MAG: hypothetical protein Q9213_003218 [Squamulea squamosa]
MATSDPDPLLRLRQSIAADDAPVTTNSPDPNSDATENLAVATHLQFSNPHLSYPLETPTRFLSSDKPVNLRSIWFAWQKKDVAIPDYIASAQALNEELTNKNAVSRVQNLVFVERLDLITWLEGASEESEYIKGLESGASAKRSAQVASGAAGGVSTIPSGAAGARGARTVDPRLQEIYNGERRMGDRNSVLRGIKPTEHQDFSHVRKIAETFLSRSRPSKSLTTAPNPSLVSLPGKPPINSGKPSSHRRPDPIILLSPSASSLLRLSNIKLFLSDGLYTPPTTSNHANILHLTRLLPSIDPHRPLRFILVDTPEQFKPDYWNRVVAVFTTGQTWQFKGYKWQDPRELFKEALGVYVGWRGEDLPPSVRGWGRGVLSVGVEKWNPAVQGAGARWRDREVVEGIWGRVEEWMRSKGWGKEGLAR